MLKYWVIDTKLTAPENTGLITDGSPYYYARSVVPATHEQAAIERLREAFEKQRVFIDEVLAIALYDSKEWNSEDDEDFETLDSYHESLSTGQVSFGCVVSESARTNH